MARPRHLDTCPVGIATQRPELRRSSPRRRRMSRRTSASSRRRCDGSSRASVSGGSRRPSAASAPAARSCGLSACGRGAARHRWRLRGRAAASRTGRRARRAARRRSRPALEEARLLDLRYPTATPTRRPRRGSPADRVAVRRRRASWPHQGRLHRQRGQLRRVLDGRRSAGVDGEANDYVGKSMSGGRIVVGAPAGDAGTRARRQHRPRRRNRRRAVRCGSRRRALRGAQLGGERGCGCHWRSRVRVHDRRDGGRARRGRPRRRRGDEGRRAVRLRCRTPRAARNQDVVLSTCDRAEPLGVRSSSNGTSV